MDPSPALPDPARVHAEAGSLLRRRVAAAIVAQRRMAGLSQEALAERSGLHRTYLAGVEGAKRNPSLDSLAQIAAGLGIPLSELFRVAEAMGPQAPSAPREGEQGAAPPAGSGSERTKRKK